MIRYIAVLLVFAGIFSGPAQAKGLFDFLDPCIGAKEEFWAETDEILEDIDFQLMAVAGEKPTREFWQWWWDEKKRVLSPYFDREIWPILTGAGAKDIEAGWQAWLQRQIDDAGGWAHLEGLMATEFRRLRRLYLLKERGETQATLDAEKKKLYGSCPQDVASQIFRGSKMLVTAPVGIISQNMEIAKRESGAIAKGIAGTTGISVDAIKKSGPLGGKNSEARKVCKALLGKC